MAADFPAWNSFNYIYATYVSSKQEFSGFSKIPLLMLCFAVSIFLHLPLSHPPPLQSTLVCLLKCHLLHPALHEIGSCFWNSMVLYFFLMVLIYYVLLPNASVHTQTCTLAYEPFELFIFISPFRRECLINNMLSKLFIEFNYCTS